MFVQGCSGEPAIIHDIIRDDPALMPGTEILTSFVSGINRLDCALMETAKSVAGFFPPPVGFAGRHDQIISNYLNIGSVITRRSPELLVLPVSQPDAQGRVRPGVSAEFADAAMDAAKVRVAVVSPTLPRLANGWDVALERFTHVINDDCPPLSRKASGQREDPVITAVGRNVAHLVDNGTTLQTGIGKIPSALFPQLNRHKGLRIHSGMVTGEIRALVDAGALDHAFPVCAATLYGPKDFYSWLDGRRDFDLQPVSITHSPATLSRLERFISINSAIEIDLLGQVNAEKAGEQLVSAAGGLPDFSTAAHRARHGRSIIALTSSDRSGTISKIIPVLGGGAAASMARTDLDFAVTEFGIADLQGKTAEARACAIANIAAPQFRDDLLSSIRAIFG